MPFVKISVSISLKFTHPTQLARERDPAAKELAQICRVVVHEIFQILWLADLESDHLAGLVRRSGEVVAQGDGFGAIEIVAGFTKEEAGFAPVDEVGRNFNGKVSVDQVLAALEFQSEETLISDRDEGKRRQRIEVL